MILISLAIKQPTSISKIVPPESQPLVVRVGFHFYSPLN